MFLEHRSVQKCRKLVLASLEAKQPPHEQKSNLPHKTPLHAKFQIIPSIGGFFTALLAGVRSLCSPPLQIKDVNKSSLESS